MVERDQLVRYSSKNILIIKEKNVMSIQQRIINWNNYAFPNDTKKEE